MEEEIAVRIESAVAECLTICDASATLYTCLAVFIRKLQADSTWIDKQIIEVQVRAMRVRLYRERTGQSARVTSLAHPAVSEGPGLPHVAWRLPAR